MPIDIVFIDNDSRPTNDWVNGYPCIRVGIFYDPAPKLGVTYKSTDAWALIDTGADHVYVQKEILQKHRAPPGQEIRTNNEERKSGVYRCAVFVPAAAETINFRTVIDKDFAAMKLPFRVVLGRSFLSVYKLDFDINNRVAKLSR